MSAFNSSEQNSNRPPKRLAQATTERDTLRQTFRKSYSSPGSLRTIGGALTLMPMIVRTAGLAAPPVFVGLYFLLIPEADQLENLLLGLSLVGLITGLLLRSWWSAIYIPLMLLIAVGILNLFFGNEDIVSPDSDLATNIATIIVTMIVLLPAVAGAAIGTATGKLIERRFRRSAAQ